MNNDNEINILDFSLLVDAFNTVVGDTNYLEAANLSDDNSVDIIDFSLLVNNFNTSGQKPSGL